MWASTHEVHVCVYEGVFTPFHPHAGRQLQTFASTSSEIEFKVALLTMP